MKLRGLYAITPTEVPDGQRLSDMAEAAVRGGARVLQYRDKSQDREKRFKEARKLRDICRAANVPLIINDDIALAAACDADGVHLGRDDAALAEARERLGPKALIGVSCYNRLELAEQAQTLGADYIAFGRFFPSSSKPEAVQAQPQLLTRARAELTVPIVAIGGISPQNGGPLIRAGAHMLAVIDALFGAADIEDAAKAFATLFAQEENP